MGIDFHNEENRYTYTTREADLSWRQTISNLVQIENISTALDIGCGGGIYSKALSDMGVASVIGVDFSEVILEGARENCKEYKNIRFKVGNAHDTGLKSNSVHFVLQRALIHHIEDLHACFKEAYRVLKKSGTIIVQDRTPDDCIINGDNSHIRGYFFEFFPKLIEKEKKRRYDSSFVIKMLQKAGFKEVEVVKLWETRKVYKNKADLLNDIQNRTGRSILHELDDNELKLLTKYLDKSIPINNDIIEKDRWTIWKAVKK